MASKLDELMELAIVAADIRSSDTAEFYAGRRVSERNYKEALAALQSALKAVVEDAERYQAWKDAYMSEEDDPTPVMIAITNAWTPADLDDAIDAARKP